MQDFFSSVADWLLERSLSDAELSDTVESLGKRLVNGGVPVNRIAIGRSMLHPVIGLITLTWDLEKGRVDWDVIPRNRVAARSREKTPFAELMLQRTRDEVVADLSDPGDCAQYPLFEQLAESGVTGYAGFAKTFGDNTAIRENDVKFGLGAAVSFSTRSFGGFSPDILNGLRHLLTPLMVCVRLETEKILAATLLDSYLGRLSGRRVLTGQTARGDGNRIDCALFFSDLASSLPLSCELEERAYLQTLNDYFDCTAGAVLDHGGEVLKFVGDGVLAIFPFEQTTRPAQNMCMAALSAARESFARATQLNTARVRDNKPIIEFGVALHAGQVLYGNVGTEKRLDFTATGQAVGLLTRCEALTRDLESKILATDEFVHHHPESSGAIGAFELKGYSKPVELHQFPV
ncbi:adenylate/guanylate cyclase domain-containing protein [Tropicibacter sp. Alg240-R139]|uniref:adenylate/guanylate cyclase domain-containing protein n=1 Tax=Tropicibacter sp. Alg240-R139 TaxID=2305991 RepID=UPI0013DF7529|nr:adenylate/guanylate cyclase domain-containing protein [Tropicibacter sp. Alg240-R139]